MPFGYKSMGQRSKPSPRVKAMMGSVMPRGSKAGEMNSGANRIKNKIIGLTPGGTGFQGRANKLKKALAGEF